MGMHNERIKAKDLFNIFTDKLVTFIMSTFKNGSDVVCVVRDLKHSVDTFEAAYLPQDKSEDEVKKSLVQRLLYDNKVKLYVHTQRE